MYYRQLKNNDLENKMKSDFFDKQAKAMEESKFFQNLQGRMNDVSTNISGIT